MSSRPLLAPFPVITNASMTTTVTSAVTVIQNTSMLSYDISWTGSPNGSFSVQASNTFTQNSDGTVRNVGNWDTLPLSSSTVITPGAGSGMIDIDASGFYAIRLVYTPTSGTGTLNATISGKVA